MTAEFVTPQQVRDYLRYEGDLDDDPRYGDSQLGSNIRAAGSFLQRVTRRQFEGTTGSRTYSTDGRAVIPIPDLRSVSSVNLQEVALESNQTYWLIPDPVAQAVGETIYTAIQLRPFGSNSYLANPQWFDRNLDRDWRRGLGISTLPNDLVVASQEWGWADDVLDLPEDLKLATKVLSGFYTKRPEAVLANVRISPEGAVLNYGELPLEVVEFIRVWSRHDQVVAGGVSA